MQRLAGLYGCRIANFPFTYLGLPLGLSKPRIRDFDLIHRVERLLTSCPSLSFGGRITVTKAVLSALPAFYICSLKLPEGVIGSIDKARRICLWGES